MRCVIVILALWLFGCSRHSVSVLPSPAAGIDAGKVEANLEHASEQLELLAPSLPPDAKPAFLAVQQAIRKATDSLNSLADKLKAAAKERDELRTERDRAVQELETTKAYWAKEWLGGRGKAWLSIALAIAAIGVILRLIALFVLNSAGAVVSRVGSLLLCVSIIGAPLLWAFDEIWLAKARRP